MSLTDTAIRKLRPTDKPFKLGDSARLYLLIKPNGSKLWYMKYRIDEKEKKLAFGPYPDVSLFKTRQQEKGEKDRYRGGMTPRRIPALAGSPYRVLAETPYTSTNCHSGVKVSFWRSQKAYAGDCVFFNIRGGVWVS